MSREREIRERADAARPGPWVRGKFRGDLDIIRQENWTGCDDPTHDNCAIAQVTTPDVAIVRLGHPEYDAKPNAEFIAHAREDIPHLLSIIDEQRAEMERLRSEVRRWKQKYEMADTEW